MAEEERIHVGIQSTFDPGGTTAATDGLHRTEAAAHTLKDELKELGWSADTIGGKLKGMLVEVVALAEFVAQAKEGWAEFHLMAKAWSQLEMATAHTGEEFTKVKKEIEELAEGFAELAGVQDDELVPSVVKLYRGYGDMENTTKAVNLAFAVSRAHGLEFNEALDVVVKTSIGATRGLRDLNIVIDEGKTPREKAEEGLRKLAETSRGATLNTASLAVQTAKLGVEWENIRGAIVEKVVPAILWSIKALKTAFDSAGAAVAQIASKFMLLGDRVVAFGALLKNVFTVGPREAAATFRKEWSAATEEAAKRTTDIWDKVGEHYVDNWQKVIGKVNVGVSDIPEAIIKGTSKGTSKGLKAMENDITHAYNLWAAAERRTAEEERRAWEQRRRHNEQWAEWQERKEKWLDHLAEKTREATEAEIKLAKQKAEAEQQFARDTALAGMGQLADYFGMQKEFALAEAVINTYEGATKALAQGGIYGPILAAIVIAAGMAQVATIASTEPATSTTGKGFDDPVNDRAAYLGGRRWAQDMIGEFTQGVSRGWAEGMAASRGTQSTTVNNSRTTNVHMHGAGLIDPTNVQLLKALKRNLDTIDLQVEQQRVVGRLG